MFVPVTPVSGPAQSAPINQIISNQNELRRTTGVSALRSAVQGVPNDTYTSVNLVNTGGDTWDTDGLHSDTVAPSRITIPDGLGGRWVFRANVTWDSNNTGIRQMRITKNGGEQAIIDSRQGAGFTSANGSIELRAVPGDYFELQVRQASGATLNLNRGLFQASFVGGL